MMKDKEFLRWMYDRLNYQYGENELTDYMNKFRCILKDMDEDKCSPNIILMPLNELKQIEGK